MDIASFPPAVLSTRKAANLPLVDLMITAEAQLERRLMALAAIYPKTILQSAGDFMPEVDTIVKAFWRQYQSRRDEILAANDDKSITLVLSCSEQKEFEKNITLTIGINAYEAAPKIVGEIKALRLARKAARWVEESGILLGAIA